MSDLDWDTRFKGVRVIKTQENLDGMSLKDMKGKATQVRYICFHESGSEIQNGMEGRPLLISEKTMANYIDGFTIGVKKFREGEKGYIWIPKKLGYGKDNFGDERLSGNLVYYLEILEKNPGKK